MDSQTDQTDRTDRTKHTAGWVALAAAIVIAFAATGEVVVTAKSGSPSLILSLVGSFLGFSAACFGLASYDKVVDSRVTIAQLGREASGQTGQKPAALPAQAKATEDPPKTGDGG